MYVECDESSLYSRINYVHSPGGNAAGVSRIIKTMHTGFSAYAYCVMPTPRCEQEETGRYDCDGKICVVFWMLSVNSNELSKV